MRTNKTNERFMEEVEQFWGNRYTVLGKYENARKNVLIHCSICNADFMKRPSSLTCTTSRSGCPTCGMKGMGDSKRTAYKDVKQAFNDRGYQLLETEYKNNRTLMQYRCPIHPEKENKINYSNLSLGKGCPYCGTESAASKIRTPFARVKVSFINRGYELLETKYKDRKTPMKYKCPVHPDKDLIISYDGLLKGDGCAHCAGMAKYTHEEVVGIFNLRGYELLEKEYRNGKTPMKYRCPDHPNKLTKISLTKLMHNRGCPYCSKVGRPTFDEVKNLFSERGYELLESEYKTAKSPMKYRCAEHANHVQITNVDRLMQGKGCPCCCDRLNSKLSRKIEAWLNSQVIPFNREHRFPDCKLKRSLSFDFYLPQHNICIEADGEQHFSPVTFGGISKELAKKEFENVVIRDSVKNKYCKKKGIELIRIPYFEIKKVEKILNKAIH